MTLSCLLELFSSCPLIRLFETWTTKSCGRLQKRRGIWREGQTRPRLLAQAFLTDVPKGVELCSVGVRRAEVTAGVFLCSLVRDGLRCSVACDGVMMDAGSIRRNHVYPSDYAQFTYGDLKKVTPPSLPPITRFMQRCLATCHAWRSYCPSRRVPRGRRAACARCRAWHKDDHRRMAASVPAKA